MSAFRVQYLPPNQCWCVMFGDSPLIIDADVLGEAHGRTLFATREEAEQALRAITSRSAQ